MEQELRAAKNSGAEVRVSLAVETSFTNADCEVVGVIVEFDKGDVKLELVPNDSLGIRAPWLAKAFIVAVEVLG